MNLLFAVLPFALLASDDFCTAYLDRLLIVYPLTLNETARSVSRPGRVIQTNSITSCRP